MSNSVLKEKCIKLESSIIIDKRIEFVKLLLDNSQKRLGLIETARNSNLNYALITFAAAFGGSIKFFPNVHPAFISLALLCLSLSFLYREFQFHRYSHGWVETTRRQIEIHSFLLNDPSKSYSVPLYCETGELKAKRKKERFTPSRLTYYLMVLASFVPFLKFLFYIIWGYK